MPPAPDFSSRRRRLAERPLDVALVAAGLLAAVASAYAASSARADLGQARRAAEEARREIAVLEPRARGLSQQLGSVDEGLDGQATLTASAAPPRLVTALSRLLPPDVRLESLGLAYRKRVEVEARVAARHPAAYDLFLERLAASQLFEAIVPGPEDRTGEVAAQVQMIYRGGASR